MFRKECVFLCRAIFHLGEVNCFTHAHDPFAGDTLDVRSCQHKPFSNGHYFTIWVPETQCLLQILNVTPENLGLALDMSAHVASVHF